VGIKNRDGTIPEFLASGAGVKEKKGSKKAHKNTAPPRERADLGG